MLSDPRHGAQGEPGRHHRDRRQLRHLAGPDAAPDSAAGHAAAEPARRQRATGSASRPSRPTSRRCAANPAATNCALLVGHTTLRVATLDDLEQPATAAEIGRMRALVQEALEAGAIGVSTGLFYEPADRRADGGSDRDLPPARRSFDGAVLHPHARRGRPRDGFAGRNLPHRPRSRRAGRDLAPQGGGPGATTAAPRKRSAFIRKSMAQQPICLDCYPYTAGSTVLSADRAATLVTRDRQLVEAAAASTRARTWPTSRAKLGVAQDEAIARLLPRRRASTSGWTRPTCSAS